MNLNTHCVELFYTFIISSSVTCVLMPSVRNYNVRDIEFVRFVQVYVDSVI